MPSAVGTITERVRARVRREGVDLAGDRALAHRYVREEVQRYAERALGGAEPVLGDETATESAVLASLTGFGALQPLLDDDEVEEVWINAPHRVFAARGGVAELTPVVLTDAEVRDLVERMLQHSGRRLDLSSPFVDASLPDGSRLHVVIPEVTSRHWAVNIRKFSRRPRDLQRLVALGSLDRRSAEFLRLAVLAGLNILVSGATQAGKTTLLGALLSAAAPSERIVTAEETFELAPAARDVVAMQCRQPSLEGTGEITLRRLVKEALRMRPDRLVVGEVREAEALDLLIALNSGIPGMCSIHANSADDALRKLCTLPLLAGRNIDSSFVVPTVASTVDLVVHCRMLPDGRRRVAAIAEPIGGADGEPLRAVDLFALDREAMRRTGAPLTRAGKFRDAGLDPRPLLEATA
ncbi:CpaF family protein [Naasia sp. SYSU D00948]|uniref:CpaF family protein n=1 Tax=Naasia sp. SYSU D00948 TaxID=2817379 RepID=UPI001B311707|nr:ATPase, T2SS/T4P/T4SS family [Naasia sp. SYSU D00948]